MSSAPKEHNISAQGNALGTESQHTPEALKGRNNVATDGCFAPSGLGPLDGSPTQGVALGWYVLALQATGQLAFQATGQLAFQATGQLAFQTAGQLAFQTAGQLALRPTGQIAVRLH
jgi:hypothetical protein